MKLKIITLLTCLLIFTVNVFSQHRKWEKARKTNTIISFEKFITKYPNSEFVYSANELVDSINFNNCDLNNLSALRLCFSNLRSDKYRIIAQSSIEQWGNHYWENNVINSDKSANYIFYLKEFPQGKFVDIAIDYVKIPISIARAQMDDFNKDFNKSILFSDEQVKSFIENLENETYSYVLQRAIEYYVIEGNNCYGSKLTKRGYIVNRAQKACLLNLKAMSLEIEAIYVSDPTIKRALFDHKWNPSMTHNGCAGPGLEIDLPEEIHREFEVFLYTYSIVNRELNKGFVIPDLLEGSADNGSPYPNKGTEITITKHSANGLTFKVEGVTGMPFKSITSYKEALALKTYLKVINNEK